MDSVSVPRRRGPTVEASWVSQSWLLIGRGPRGRGVSGGRPSGISFYRQWATKCSCSAPGCWLRARRKLFIRAQMQIHLTVCLGQIPRRPKKKPPMLKNHVARRELWLLVQRGRGVQNAQGVFNLFLFLHQDLNDVVRKQTDPRLPHRQIIIMIIIKMDYVLSR